MAAFKPQIDAFRTREAMRFLLNMLRNFEQLSGFGAAAQRKTAQRKSRRSRSRQEDELLSIFDCEDFGGGHVPGPMIRDRDVFCVPARLVTNESLHAWYDAKIPAKARKAAEEKQGPHKVSFDDDTAELLRCLWCDNAIRSKLMEHLASLRIPDSKENDVFETNFRGYCDALRLDDLDRDLLLIAYFFETDWLQPPSHAGHRDTSARIEAFAMCADRSMEEVRAAVAASAPLQRYGCIDGDLDFCSELSAFFDGLDKAPAESRFYRRDTEKPLPWNWFGKLAEQHGTLLRRLLATSDGGPAHILLYGVPGTGKTSFARAIAAETGRECFFVRQLRDRRRLGAIRACDVAVDPGKSLIVVDECDALLEQSSWNKHDDAAGEESADKGALNALLDGLRTPVVWICNASPRRMDDSNLRRFAYSVPFDAPTRAQRASVWRHQAETAGLQEIVTPAMCDDFAGRWPVSAGGIAAVLGNVARLRPEAGEVVSLVEAFMKPHCKLMGVKAEEDNALRPAKDYSLDGLAITSSVPLQRIVTAARRFRAEIDGTASSMGVDKPRFNLLLSGPPGTGKTEFVKYLGAELGAKVVVKMGSDLLSMWVGGTEQNIAAAFREAEEEGAILFLDEVDGMLRSRGLSHQSWEVTKVNELLHQMENFRGILVCATNFSDNLDPATVRRFTFKVGFDYLSNEGKAAFFERMFERTLTDGDRATLDTIPDLAPGDFRTVRQSLRYLGEEADNSAYLSALRDESKAKRFPAGSAGRGTIGF